ncbi:MAG: hypothetical protein RIA09_19340 [Hoeflea sp.]|uniref:hypothetical protein n=1 Tax=Hoeflea sp. TaxID=1940281 RepID=UPI0032EBCFEF
MARSLLGTLRCGRLPYALIIIAILAADFLKTPLETYFGKLHTDAMQSLVSDAQETDAAILVPRLTQRELAAEARRHLQEVYDQRMEEYRAHKQAFPESDRAPPELMDRQVAQQWALRQPGLALMPNQAQLREAQRVSTGIGAINSLYMAAVGVLGIVSMLAIALAVLARVRDIGWPAWTGVAVLSVFMIKIWTLQAVPFAVSMALQGLFLALILGLALVPAGFDFRRKPDRTVAPQPAAAGASLPGQSRGSPSGRAQFGRRTR